MERSGSGNPRNYRNYKRGDIIVSLAGVATNFMLFPICALLIVILGLIAPDDSRGARYAGIAAGHDVVRGASSIFCWRSSTVADSALETFRTC